MKNIFLILASTLLLWSCTDDFDPEVNTGAVEKGSADFSTYVAVGNSLTAGYSNGALYKSGQENSYPAIMASQMAFAGGGEFSQPYMPDDIGGFSNFGIAGKLQLVVNDQGDLTPVPTASESPFTPVNGLYNNVGVPGAKSYHLIAPGYGNQANLPNNANAYFVRMATSPNNTVLAEAVGKNPTFFSLWIGNNDVLGYATAGGDVSQDQITDPALFEQAYGAILQGLTANGAKGVVASLPYVTSIPFFTTVPYNPISPEKLGGEAGVNSINTNLYGPLVQLLNVLGAGDRIQLLSSTQNNPLLINDESLTDLSSQITYAAQNSGNPQLAALAPILGAQFGKARMATKDDLVLLTTSSVIGKVDNGYANYLQSLGLDAQTAGNFSVNGVALPLKDHHVLTSSEVAECTLATDSYNNIIENMSSSFGLAFYDAKADMERLGNNSGLLFDGVSYNADFVTGGAFSLDGVHPNGRGYAIIANGFLSAINKKYSSTLPMVSPNNYPGVEFPD